MAAGAAAACSEAPTPAPTPTLREGEGPLLGLAGAGHGAVFDAKGEIVAPDLDHTLVLQDQLVAAVRAASKRPELAEAAQGLAELTLAPNVQVVANAALLEWMLRDDAFLTGKFGEAEGLLKLYASSSVDFAAIYASEPELGEALSNLGVDGYTAAAREARRQQQLTGAQAYRLQCSNAGVPIPPPWTDPRWIPSGSLDPDVAFLDITDEIRIYTYRDPNVPGLCVALPRVDEDGDRWNIDTMGIICQSSVTGSACFWDNVDRPDQNRITGDLEQRFIAIDDMANGSELNEVCTDCHRGENVFLLHPGTDLSFGADSVSPVWYRPIGRSAFVNPPMFRRRDLTEPSACNTCHAIANLAPVFCSRVMREAADLSMPSAADPVEYDSPQGSHALSFLDIKDVCEGDATAFCGSIDADGDGHGDPCDNCPFVANYDQLDRDRDYRGDACDTCPRDAYVAQTDTDGDGVGDACDVCDYTSDPEQLESDGDGLGDACDVCPENAYTSQVDQDGDGWGDACDTCLYVPNPRQLTTDRDFDGVTDDCDGCPHQFFHPDQSQPIWQRECEPDAGVAADGWCSLDCSFPAPAGQDNCPVDHNLSQTDTDSDGMGDPCDPNIDDDPWPNETDNCPTVKQVNQDDGDGDGVGTACDCDDTDPRRATVPDCVLDPHTLAKIEAAAHEIAGLGRDPWWEGEWGDIVGCAELGCPDSIFDGDLDVSGVPEEVDVLTFVDLVYDDVTAENGVTRDKLGTMLEEHLLVQGHHRPWD